MNAAATAAHFTAWQLSNSTLLTPHDTSISAASCNSPLSTEKQTCIEVQDKMLSIFGTVAASVILRRRRRKKNTRSPTLFERNKASTKVIKSGRFPVLPEALEPCIQILRNRHSKSLTSMNLISPRRVLKGEDEIVP